MEQHPIPQHIASFEFKLFGPLTIRQFFLLSIPMAFAAVFFFSSLPLIVRFPLSAIFAVIGLVAALVPVGGRPLDKWLVAFTRAILSPTQRVWVKEAKIPQFLNIVTYKPKVSQTPPQPITFQDRQRLSQYLRSLPKSTVSPLDVKEQKAVEKLGFTPNPPAGGQTPGRLPPPILWITPGEKAQQGLTKTQAPTEEEQFQGIMSQALPQITPLVKTPTAIKISSHAKPYTLPGLEKKLTQKQITPTPKIQLASDTNFSIENIIPTPGKHIRLFYGLAKTRTRKLHFAPPKDFNLANLPVRGEARFEVSEELKKRFQFDEPEFQPITKTEETAVPAPAMIKTGPSVAKTGTLPKQNRSVPGPQATHFRPQNATLKKQQSELADSKITIQGQNVEGTKPASILGRAHIIPLTNTPNVLSGLVSDAADISLEGAIIIVRDRGGIPVRALKTNKLGQFLSLTPLSSGVYSLEIEHLSAHFEPVTINLTGNIMSPLEIKAKN